MKKSQEQLKAEHTLHSSPKKDERKGIFSRCRTMFFLLIALPLLTLSVKAQTTRTPISMQNATVEQVLNKIEENSDYVFLFNENAVDKSRVTSVHESNSITAILDELFKGTSVKYVINNRQIILSTEEQQPTTPSAVVQHGTGDLLTISGVVREKSGEPMAGVTVYLPNTSVGTATTADGKFTIKAKKGNIVEFRYMGYLTQAVTISGSHPLNITMKQNDRQLGEVVVTAMGIQRKAQSLTYATQTVGGDELTRAKETNLVNSLQGKSAGLIITPNSSGAGSASKILLRGNASMLGNNSPLIVLDGVPMYNKVQNQLGLDGGSSLMAGTAEGDDPLSQLNPDDIEKITVLKGANSAALYGSAASNGVLMITTKKGRQGQLRVDVSSSTSFETPLVKPKLQSVYGSVIGGSLANGYSIGGSSWGGKLSDMTADQLNPANSKQRLTNNAYDVSDFFRTGTTFNNSIAFSGGTEKVQTYFSYANTNANGIMPTNHFSRNNFALRENFSFFKDKLKMDLALNYIDEKTKNRPSSGMYSTLANVYTAARNVDMDYYQHNYYTPDGSWTTSPYSVMVKNGDAYTLQTIQTTLKGDKQLWYLQDAVGKNNPWWAMNRNSSEEITHHVFGSLGATYTVYQDLNVQARVRYDYQENRNEAHQYATTMRPSDMLERGRLIWPTSSIAMQLKSW